MLREILDPAANKSTKDSDYIAFVSKNPQKVAKKPAAGFKNLQLNSAGSTRGGGLNKTRLAQVA